MWPYAARRRTPGATSALSSTSFWLRSPPLWCWRRPGLAPPRRSARNWSSSQLQLLQRFTKTLPDMYPKAYRWVAEMREIVVFAAEDAAASRVYDAFADLYERLAADYRGSRAETQLIEMFLSHPE